MAVRDQAREIVMIQNQLAGPMPVRDRGILLRRQATLWEGAFPGAPFERIARKAGMLAA